MGNFRKIDMMFLYNVDWKLDKRQIKRVLKAIPDARLVDNPSNQCADYELWVPEEDFLIAWTLINYHCLIQKPSKNCKKIGLDCKNDCPQMYSESGLALYERNLHTVKNMYI